MSDFVPNATVNGSQVVRAWRMPNGLVDSAMVQVLCADGRRHIWLTGITPEKADQVVARLVADPSMRSAPAEGGERP